MKTLIRYSALGIAALSALALGASALPAQASEVHAPAGETPTPDYCWSEVDTGKSACADSPQDLAQKMFDDFGVVYGGDNIPTDSVAPTGSATSRAAVNQTFLLAKIYDGKNYSGTSWSLTTQLSSKPCQAAQSYVYGQYASLGNIGTVMAPQNWNDRISSFQGYDGCKVQLYRDRDFRGSVYAATSKAGDLGAFNKEASSLSIRK